MKIAVSSIVMVALTTLMALAQSPVIKEPAPGINNLARIENTVACAGAITPESVTQIQGMGFKSIFNLRLATEQGANIEAETAAAKSAGLNYVHIPFSNASPDPAAVDSFLQAIAVPVNQPAFIHCGSGNRAAAMWFIKRALIDKWDIERASAEAAQLGLTSQPLRAFALDYIQKHQ